MKIIQHHLKLCDDNCVIIQGLLLHLVSRVKGISENVEDHSAVLWALIGDGFGSGS